MKKSTIHKCLLALVLVFGLAFRGNAQSATTISGVQDLEGQTEYAQYLYIGPGAIVTLTDDWIISSQYIFIDPTAQILGPGRMIIDNPANFNGGESAAWAGQPTTIDGGNAKIMAPVLVRNPNNVVLGTVPVAASGGDITAANSDHTLYIGNNIDFATTNGDGSAITSNDVVLGNNDLKIATTATITNYGASRFVVTNGTGHLYKEPYTGSFEYPVGITDGDYTPATIVNASSNGMHVSVQNYTSSASDEIVGASGNGMQRTWNIYADNAAGNSTISLQHNSSTNQSGFADGSHFVTRWGSTTPNPTGDNPVLAGTAWQSNTLGAGAVGSVAGSSVRSRAYTDFATSAGSPTAYYSKSSDPHWTLPIKLTAFAGKTINCTIALNWKTAEEGNAAFFELQRSVNGTTFTKVATISPKGSYSIYNYTDAAAPTGTIQYRLRMVDKDGFEEYSTIISLNNNCSGPVVITAYPNPVKDIVTVSGVKKQSLVKLINPLGQVLTNIAVVNNTVQVNMVKFPKGTYVLQIIENNTITSNIRLVKE
jgi:hypothetical protein